MYSLRQHICINSAWFRYYGDIQNKSPNIERLHVKSHLLSELQGKHVNIVAVLWTNDYIIYTFLYLCCFWTPSLAYIQIVPIVQLLKYFCAFCPLCYIMKVDLSWKVFFIFWVPSWFIDVWVTWIQFNLPYEFRAFA